MWFVIFTLPSPGVSPDWTSPHWFGVDLFVSLFYVRAVWDGIGPPGQVNAVAGEKEGPKQGAIGGILKELGYTEDQVFKF
jgi:hypothetical protein